ncbi:MAG: 7-carboxy-7-deazaguanine synthase QueE [Planctomycetota bacterium]
MDSDRLYLDEVFLSLQGEGLEVGRPQLFLRLGGCPLRCSYCDTPRSWNRRAQYEVHLSGNTLLRENPVECPQLQLLLEELLAEHRLTAQDVMLSITGGEPLEQASFLKAWLPTWQGAVLLETAGVQAQALNSLLPEIDLLSLDWKLSSTLREGQDLLQTEACLEAAAAQKVRTQVKLVLTQEQTDAEIGLALQAIAKHLPKTVVFLQPVTPFGKGPLPPSAEQLLDWSLQHRALPLDLRVLPQIHPLLGIR